MWQKAMAWMMAASIASLGFPVQVWAGKVNGSTVTNPVVGTGVGGMSGGAVGAGVGGILGSGVIIEHIPGANGGLGFTVFYNLITGQYTIVLDETPEYGNGR